VQAALCGGGAGAWSGMVVKATVLLHTDSLGQAGGCDYDSFETSESYIWTTG